MIVEVERRPRIVVDFLVNVEGEWFDLIELRAAYLALDIGDVELDDMFDRELSTCLSRLGVIKTYSTEEKTIMVSAGPKYEDLRKSLNKMCHEEGISDFSPE